MQEFYNPVRIISGRDCFKNFAGLAEFGKRCFVVTGGHSARACGALDDALASFAREGIECEIFDRITPNPLVSVCREGGARAREFGADFVLGIGGGSPLDAAKAIAAFAADPSLDDDTLYTKKLGDRKPTLPIILVGTTAGTGSEATQYAVLTYPAVQNKKTFSGPDTFARIAFLDPAYTYSLPMDFTVSTAVDALSHVIEGTLCNKSNDFTDALALRACRMISDGLRELSSGDISRVTREKLLYASTMAGQVISRTGTGFVHSMGYPLTYYHGVPHGVANAMFLADFVDFMETGAHEKVSALLGACGVDGTRELEGLYVPLMNLSFEADDETLKSYAHTAIGARGIQGGAVVASESDLFELYKNSKFRRRAGRVIKSRFDPATAALAHQGTMLCSPVLPDGTPAPFEHAWGYRDKAGRTEYHKHDKEEIYIIMKGEGTVIIDGDEQPVKAGDVIYIPPNAYHTLVNPADRELLWAGMWWNKNV